MRQAEAWAKKANKAVDLGLKNYRLGLISNTQVVQLQASRERAALSFASAQRDFHIAYINWNILIGKDIQNAYKGL